MTYCKINFETALSKSRMLEIQRLTRNQAMSVNQIAAEMELSSPVISPYVRHMRENNMLYIEYKESHVYADKPIHFYRWDGVLIVDKSRNGEWEGRVKLYFDKASLAFSDRPSRRSVMAA